MCSQHTGAEVHLLLYVAKEVIIQYRECNRYWERNVKRNCTCRNICFSFALPSQPSLCVGDLTAAAMSLLSWGYRLRQWFQWLQFTVYLDQCITYLDDCQLMSRVWTRQPDKLILTEQNTQKRKLPYNRAALGGCIVFVCSQMDTPVLHHPEWSFQ
jgi:hypothetical protein